MSSEHQLWRFSEVDGFAHGDLGNTKAFAAGSQADAAGTHSNTLNQLDGGAGSDQYQSIMSKHDSLHEDLGGAISRTQATADEMNNTMQGAMQKAVGHL
jgi:hypothetical protein